MAENFLWRRDSINYFVSWLIGSVRLGCCCFYTSLTSSANIWIKSSWIDRSDWMGIKRVPSYHNKNPSLMISPRWFYIEFRKWVSWVTINRMGCVNDRQVCVMAGLTFTPASLVLLFFSFNGLCEHPPLVSNVNKTAVCDIWAMTLDGVLYNPLLPINDTHKTRFLNSM